MSSRSMAEGKDKPSDLHLDRLAVYQAFQRSTASPGGLPLWFAKKWLPLGVGMLLLSSGALAATWLSVRHRTEVSPTVSVAAPISAAIGTRPHVGLPGDPEPLSPPVGVRGRVDPSSAADLFARARTARLGGNAEAALSIYRRLQRAYPDSREGHLSYLVVGRMWLERGRPELAAHQFSRYLESGGSAWEEALVGRATSFGRTGRFTNEAADWRRLLSERPSSVYASRARTRLDELGELSGTGASNPGRR